MKNVIRFQFRPGSARFWVFENGGFVKITLRQGQSLSWGKSYDNGEGWSWESVRYTFDGQEVVCEWGHGGTDCDGRSSTSGEDACALEDLQSRGSYRPHLDAPGVLLPKWEKVAPVSCYDQFAEAAGY